MQSQSSSSSHTISVNNKGPPKGHDDDTLDDDEHIPLLAQQQQRQLSEWNVIIPLCSIVFCSAAILAPQLQFLTEIFCDRYYDSRSEANDDDSSIPMQDCTIPQVQGIVATAQAVIQLLTGGSTLLAVSYFGHMSDIKGRVTVMRIGVFGIALLFSTYIVVGKLYNVIGILPLFVVSSIRGLLVGDTGLMMAVQTYISDCTTTERRTVAFGRMIAGIVCATMLGANASSMVIKAFGTTLAPFYMSLMISTVVFFATYIIPESNKHQERSKSTAPSVWQQLNMFRSIKTLFSFQSPLPVSKYALPLMASVSFLNTVVIMPPILLYAMLEYHWTAYEGGLLIGIMSFVKLIITTVVLPILNKLVITRGITSEAQRADRLLRFNIWMVRIGCAFMALELFAIGLARTASEMLVAVLIGSFSMLGQPSGRALLTTLVDPADVGKVLGAVATVDTVGMLLAQFGMNAIYGATVSFMPSFTFHLCGVIATLACTAACFIRYKR
ncbi:hypothetical protein O0I10_009802 [Lichtheimia ornata]|uniref:Tetracycline-efflux transporter n=1 Tax=Lichtheimia ornata TaxID=688661 RepID=A0AAD7UWZ8_9FUNG|nr:uncharacterized protein O0I10_009802 [Lichtheimia ornata]KAJ8654496.1 hypothetical protein O0I10_009802 [Lichtheimia ornata]